MKAFGNAFVATWRSILQDRTALAVLILAAVFYSFYYPAAYQHQVATRLPIIVVDLDQGTMSRDLVRRLWSVRDVQVMRVETSVAAARRGVERGDADGVLVIDREFERSILRGEPGRVTFLAAGSLLGRANTVVQGLTAAVTGFAREAALVQARFEGSPAAEAIALVQRPLYNTREGYASAVVTGVAAVIVHQTLLAGIALLIGTRQEQRGRLRLHPSTLLGAMTAFWCLGILSMLFYSGFVFWLQDYPRAGNLPGLLLGSALFVSATVAFGTFVGSFFRVREHALQVILLISIPLYFLTGLSWPRTSMPTVVTWLAGLIPSTSGIVAMVKFNQLGATVGEAARELTVLALLTLVYGALAAWRYRASESTLRTEGPRHAGLE